MDYLRSRINVLTPGKGAEKGPNGKDYDSMYPDLLLESGPTNEGSFISLTIFNSKDGTKTPVGELSNILHKDSKSVKISVYDLASLYLLRLHLDRAIAISERNAREAALNERPSK